MEVVIVVQPDDWPDGSDCGSRIWGVFMNRLTAEREVRLAVEERGRQLSRDLEDAGVDDDWVDDEVERFGYEVFDVEEA